MIDALAATGGDTEGRGGVNADAAAALLGTSPLFLFLWEERFGFPVAAFSADGQRLYPQDMMFALRDALVRELSIASAITAARRAGQVAVADRLVTSPEYPEEAR